MKNYNSKISSINTEKAGVSTEDNYEDTPVVPVSRNCELDIYTGVYMEGLSGLSIHVGGLRSVRGQFEAQGSRQAVLGWRIN